MSHEFALTWMKDFDEFEDSLNTDKSYLSSLSRSMSLVLQEFYENINACGVSAINGLGFDSLMEAVERGAQEYTEVFLPDIKQRVQLNEAKKKAFESKNLDEFQKDKEDEKKKKKTEKDPKIEDEELKDDLHHLYKV